jgi:hypothetical protein
MRGFERTSSLIAPRVRKCGESRGFAVSRLLTHWPEVAGPEISSVSRPVEITYGREGFGGTLTLLTTGSHAPLLEMQSGSIRDKVNACYGYAAVARVRVTQTAATGFAEGHADFQHKAAAATEPPKPSAEARQAAKAGTAGVTDPGLKAALEQLGGFVFSAARPKPDEGST